ncbi:HPF/RaiA family ribosome-associated protein [Flavobacterium sp. K5-23]|uniref:HPF/RaiA family ribosome-associated protein n=1 Tax=Flavobacterium sp. K5-23 TaxID=2746225 RepID=UPI00200D816D|nr:HPF/RaiA family ribosome-associated protein [Flavobacterium sp. K5-23]UQD55795.1 HPF/RaiA family ribosome-associated protein [Flavobacterium sp. K5-23]
MTVQINTDKNVEGHDSMNVYFTEELRTTLARFEDKITRIEVHLRDDNADKSGVEDKRCLIEARPENMQPVAVTNYADTTEKAFHGALDKIKKVLATTFEKQKP